MYFQQLRSLVIRHSIKDHNTKKDTLFKDGELENHSQSCAHTILVPWASWGPENEDQEALRTKDLKSYILGLPVISDSQVSWRILF